MQSTDTITIIVGRKKKTININSIIYVMMTRSNTELHLLGGEVFCVRITIEELENRFGDRFVKANRGCLIAVMAIHEIDKRNIVLSNGERLSFTIRKRKHIIEQFREKQKNIINSFCADGLPKTIEEYRQHYSSFEGMPFAFADIEMIFNSERHAVDWIFRYGNPALAKLEKLPLERLIGSSFGSLFSNMDSKWLRSYERATLYGEKLEIIDYSPEIDTYLKVICFPTFEGHCGCILFDISEIEFTRNSSAAERALMLYFGKLPQKDDRK